MISRREAELEAYFRKFLEEMRTPIGRAKNTDVTNRNLADCLEYLGIREPDLVGKKVLDIGSGRFELFSRQAAKLGCEVVSLNPRLAEKEYASLAQGLWSPFEPQLVWQGRSVAALAQNLPFADETFDLVCSVYGVPIFLEREEDGDTFLQIYRVLKPGGKGYFAPIYVEETMGQITRTLGNENIPATIERVRTSIGFERLFSKDSFRLIIYK